LAKGAPNDPGHTARSAELGRVPDRLTGRLTDLQTDTAMIGNNSLHLMHSMQPKNSVEIKSIDVNSVDFQTEDSFCKSVRDLCVGYMCMYVAWWCNG